MWIGCDINEVTLITHKFYSFTYATSTNNWNGASAQLFNISHYNTIVKQETTASKCIYCPSALTTNCSAWTSNEIPNLDVSLAYHLQP